MDWVFGELPLHPLLVHFTVIVVPLAALCLVLGAIWPAARRRLSLVTPLVALAALVAVPITTNAGEWLLERVGKTPLVERHEQLGWTMLPWSIAVFAVAVAQWAWFRFCGSATRRARTRTTVAIVLGIAVAVVAIGSVVTVIQIGESGAAAVWTGNFNDQR